MKIKELICLSCPVGCKLTAKINGETVEILGNHCGAGDRYGVKECLNPRRMLTTTVSARGLDGLPYLLAVRTTDTIPKEKIFPCIAEMRGLELVNDFSIGDVLIENVLGLGVDIVVTRGK